MQKLNKETAVYYWERFSPKKKIKNKGNQNFKNLLSTFPQTMKLYQATSFFFYFPILLFLVFIFSLLYVIVVMMYSLTTIAGLIFLSFYSFSYFFSFPSLLFLFPPLFFSFPLIVSMVEATQGELWLTTTIKSFSTPSPLWCDAYFSYKQRHKCIY